MREVIVFNIRHALQAIAWFMVWAALVHGQDLATVPATPTEDESQEATESVPDQVEVTPLAADDEIASRLERILRTTQWFDEPTVTVEEGVVFLRGNTAEEMHREWAGRLASRTRDVVAVVNQIQVLEPQLFDLSPAVDELRQLGRATVRNLPLALVAILMLVLSWFAARASAAMMRGTLRRRWNNALLRQVAARAMATLVFLLGVYLALKVSGLTRLAVTVLGGTGILGLVLGFAFRDIAENFLASILISVQRPFASGDLIRVAGHEGFVQSVNTRSTLLMTIEGNILQIPNATIYKEPIRNLTANPRTRIDFLVGIGYEDSVTLAQSTIRQVLMEHEAVLSDPEPLVLVETLGAATINLRVYFWAESRKHSVLKVKSAIIRQSVAALLAAEISLPDEAREVVFPRGIPVTLSREPTRAIEQEKVVDAKPPSRDKASATEAEGHLESEAGAIQRQADTARKPEGEVNLI